MEQHSQTDDTPKSRNIFEGQIRELYGRIVYTNKTHEKCADLLLIRLGRIKLAQLILAALTTAGFATALSTYGTAGSIAGGIVSLLLLILNAYTKDYDLGELAQKHRQAASDLWLNRERLQSLLVDIRMGERPIETLQSERDQLIKSLHEIFRGAPSTNNKAYKEAQKSLQQMEDMTFTDAEIDAFLPNELKKASNSSPTHSAPQTTTTPGK